MGLLRKPKSVEELLKIEQLRKKLEPFCEFKREALVTSKDVSYPFYSLGFGEKNPKSPVIAFIGGVHGLEVIGTQIIITYLESMYQLLQWDSTITDQLKKVRLLFYPCANPAGMAMHRRSNANGVDIMRNAPVDGEGIPSFFLPGGHRLGSGIPWYRGEHKKPMQLETKTLNNFIKREMWDAPFAMAIDLHSGFGVKDRIWFPYAYSKKPFPRTAEVLALKKLLMKTYPQNKNKYNIEPQSQHYRAHGDIWDYLFMEHHELHNDKVFIPLCLELGSWLWIKKNPRQMFHSHGIFNPIIPHRLMRTLRGHLLLLDFLIRATISYEKWAILSEKKRVKYGIEAKVQRS